MFRIVVFSDSHGNTKYMEEAIEGIRDIDIIVHLGDMTRDIREIVKKYPDYRYEIVKGNCDFCDPCEDEVIFEAKGYKFLIVHGHKFGVKTGIGALLDYAAEKGVDGVLFGHTHESMCEYEGDIFVMNPGCGQAYGKSYGVIEIDGGELYADVINMR